MENKYPIGIDPQEIWDEFSEYVDDDSDSFSRYAGRSVMLFDSFVRALAKIQQPPTGAIWVKESERLPEKGGYYFVVAGKLRDKYCWPRLEILERAKEGLEFEWLDENPSPTPSNESDAVDFAEYAGTIAYYDDRYSIWKSLEEGGTIDGKLSVTTEQLYELFLKQKEVNP